MALSIPVSITIESLPNCVKRGPYIDYSQYPDVVNKIIQILKLNRRGDVPKIAKKTNFKERTLYQWKEELRKNPDFSPLRSQCGQHRRIFTDDEENSIAEYIITEYIKKGILFTDADFKELIMDAFLEKYKDSEEIPDFQASNGFVYDFKKNHRLSSKRCHTKRRPTNPKYDREFINKIENLFATVDPEYIVNVDETSWELVPSYLRGWHLTGRDHVIRYINANEKDKLTVVAAISAAGTKLPLQFIAKGLTSQVLDSQIGDV